MAKKQTEEDKYIENAAKLIMHTIRVVSVRLADRNERKLMTELMACMQAKLEANEEVDKFNNNYIVEQLEQLTKL